MTTDLEEATKINEAVKLQKSLYSQYKNLPTISLDEIKHSIVKHYGLAFTNNNRQYYAYVEVIAINNKSVRIELKKDLLPKGYEAGQQWTIYFKTKSMKNRLFSTSGNLDSFINVIKGLNECEEILSKYVEEKINQFWKDKQKEAEEQHKKDGVYVKSTSYHINFKTGKLDKIKDNLEISE